MARQDVFILFALEIFVWCCEVVSAPCSPPNAFTQPNVPAQHWQTGNQTEIRNRSQFVKRGRQTVYLSTRSRRQDIHTYALSRGAYKTQRPARQTDAKRRLQQLECSSQFAIVFLVLTPLYPCKLQLLIVLLCWNGSRFVLNFPFSSKWFGLLPFQACKRASNSRLNARPQKSSCAVRVAYPLPCAMIG